MQAHLISLPFPPQACMDAVVNPPAEGDPSYVSWKAQVRERNLACQGKRLGLSEEETKVVRREELPLLEEDT